MSSTDEKGHDRMLRHLREALTSLGEAEAQSREAVASHLASQATPVAVPEEVTDSGT